LAEREWNLPDIFAKIISFGTNNETLTGTKTLLFNDRRVQFLNPGGSDRDVVLPSEALSDGIIFWITNTDIAAGNLLTVYASDGITQKSYLAGTESCFIMCDGVTWRAGATGSGVYGTDIPVGTSMWFNQDTAPIGWSLDETITDELLAVKGGSQAYNVDGGNSAGTWTQPNHIHSTSDHTLTINEMPSHHHTYSRYANMYQGPTPGGSTWVFTTVANTGNTGGGAAHNHGSTNPSATVNTYRPKARVGIICTKD